MKKAQGIVLEINKKYLLLLTTGGDYQKVPHPGGRVRRGDEVSCRLSSPAWPKAAAAGACLAAAVFVLFAVLPLDIPYGGLPWKSDSVHGYLVLDINPSLELAYNKHLEVIACRPLNDEAVLLLEGWPEGGLLDDTVEWLLERSVSMGFLSLDLEHNLVLVTLVRVGRVEISPEPLADLLQEQLSRLGISGYVGVFETGARERREAVISGLSLNRYLLLEALRRQGEERIFWVDQPLAELLRQVNGTSHGGLFRATGKPEHPPRSPGSGAQPGPPDYPGFPGKPGENREEDEQPAPPGPQPQVPPGSGRSTGPHGW